MKRFGIFLAVLLVALLASTSGRTDTAGCVSSGLKTDNAAILASGSGHQFCSILIVTDGTNAATVTAYDNATGAGGVALFKGVVPGASYFGGGDAGQPLNLGYGLYVTVTGTGASFIVYYR